MALETVVPRDGSRDDLKVLPTEAEGLRPGDPVGRLDGYKVGPLRLVIHGVMAPINGLKNSGSWG